MSPCLSSGRQFAVSVRNTFFHCAEGPSADNEDIGAQPLSLRASTAPLLTLDADMQGLGEESDSTCPQPSACRIVTNDPFEDGWMSSDTEPEQPSVQRDVTFDLFDEPCCGNWSLASLASPHSGRSDISTCFSSCDGVGCEEIDCGATSPISIMPVGTHVADVAAVSAQCRPRLARELPFTTRRDDCRSVASAHSREPGLTTVIMRNLPNNYTQTSLMDLLDAQGFVGQYDFLYFPMDFQTHMGMGYAFVDLVTPQVAEFFRLHFEGFSDWQLQSRKVCSVEWSQPHQGLEAQVARYRNSPLMHASVPDTYRPVILEHGARVAFPPPTKKVKPPRQGMQRMLV